MFIRLYNRALCAQEMLAQTVFATKMTSLVCCRKFKPYIRSLYMVTEYCSVLRLFFASGLKE